MPLHLFRWTIPVCLLLLAGCGPLLIRDTERNAYVPAQAGTFALHKAITVGGGRTRVYLQDGEPVSGVNEFKPHCQLQVNTLEDTLRTVHPDTFTITRVSTRTDQVVQSVPLRLAALGTFQQAHFGHDDGGETRRMYVYLFYLQSDRQPDVRALICGGAFDTPGLAERPSLQEIAAALGAYGTLTLR
jgi:hypothetical protein